MLVLVLGMLAGTAHGQPQYRGIVWDAPVSLDAVELDFRTMREVGVNAVRTSIVRDERILALADTFGIAVFQDLPVRFLPGPRLADTLAAATGMLRHALERSRPYPTARHFGLAVLGDNSDPHFRQYVAQLVAVVRESGLNPVQTYYVASFAQQDAAADLVDFVLLDGLDDPDVSRRVDVWQARHETPAGIGKLGTMVSRGAAPGYRVRGSAEYQARFLEQHLSNLYGRDLPVPAVFVYRWRDRRGLAVNIRDLEDPFRLSYGLFTAEGEPRPAFRVVEGFFTGRQHVFALPAGEPPATAETSWFIVLGWSVVALFAVMYALSPLYRQMLRRYFFSHAFYCTAVREGRELFTGTNAALLICQSLAVGITAAIMLEVASGTRAFEYVARWSVPAFVETMAVFLARPGLFVLLIGAIYALSILLWVGWMVAISGRGGRFTGGKGLIVVLWPRWPLLLLMIAALLVGTLPDHLRYRGVAALAASWLLIWILSVTRSLLDSARVTRAPVMRTLVLGWLPPVLVAAVATYALLAEFRPEVTFLWRLLFSG